MHKLKKSRNYLLTEIPPRPRKCIYRFLAPTRLESWHPLSPKATWTNTTSMIAKSTALKRGTWRKRHKLGYGRIVVVMLVNIFMLSLFWPFSYSLMQFPPSILKLSTQHPPYFLNFPPSINPLLHALKTELFFPPRVCSSGTHLFVRFQKYLRTPKQYSFIQQRIQAWTNSSRRARRHVWCWVEFHPHHCLRGEN